MSRVSVARAVRALRQRAHTSFQAAAHRRIRLALQNGRPVRLADVALFERQATMRRSRKANGQFRKGHRKVRRRRRGHRRRKLGGLLGGHIIRGVI